MGMSIDETGNDCSFVKIMKVCFRKLFGKFNAWANRDNPVAFDSDGAFSDGRRCDWQKPSRAIEGSHAFVVSASLVEPTALRLCSAAEAKTNT
jgi:hypothetical protein